MLLLQIWPDLCPLVQWSIRAVSCLHLKLDWSRVYRTRPGWWARTTVLKESVPGRYFLEKIVQVVGEGKWRVPKLRTKDHEGVTLDSGFSRGVEGIDSIEEKVLVTCCP